MVLSGVVLSGVVVEVRFSWEWLRKYRIWTDGRLGYMDREKRGSGESQETEKRK